jgi:hypothetical protein
LWRFVPLTTYNPSAVRGALQYGGKFEAV